MMHHHVSFTGGMCWLAAIGNDGVSERVTMPKGDHWRKAAGPSEGRASCTLECSVLDYHTPHWPLPS